jgi:hypothetical protein
MIRKKPVPAKAGMCNGFSLATNAKCVCTDLAFESRPLQADITSAVAWRFTQNALPGLIRDEVHPSLAAFSARAEVRRHSTHYRRTSRILPESSATNYPWRAGIAEAHRNVNDAFRLNDSLRG